MRAWLADQAANMDTDYAAVRPLPLYGSRGAGYPKGKKRSDCSWGVRLVCWWTPDAPDPMGTNFQGGGNSTTICLALEHLTDPRQLEVGDLVTFGPGGDEHAAMVIEADPVNGNPLLFSDGHQGAPNTYRLSWDKREHQLLRLPLADEPSTPQDQLRAKTGYWSWMQWKLGEGAWRHYVPAAKAVRPNVPRVIPTSWWKLRAKYLLNRKKGNSAAGPR